MEVREYKSADRDACRRLYAQLVEHHREIYDEPTIGDDDPGAGFDDYLAIAERVMTWVATDGDTIVGMTGLRGKARSPSLTRKRRLSRLVETAGHPHPPAGP